MPMTDLPEFSSDYAILQALKQHFQKESRDREKDLCALLECKPWEVVSRIYAFRVAMKHLQEINVVLKCEMGDAIQRIQDLKRQRDFARDDERAKIAEEAGRQA